MAGKEQQDGYADMKADPGMVLNYKAAEEVQPQPAAPQPDLLDFDGLSMDAPPAQVSPCMCSKSNASSFNKAQSLSLRSFEDPMGSL